MTDVRLTWVLLTICAAAEPACHGPSRDKSDLAPAPPAVLQPRSADSGAVSRPEARAGDGDSERPTADAGAAAEARPVPVLEPAALDAQGREIVRRMARLESYSASVAERGVLGGDEVLESEVLFRAPSSFRSTVTRPEPMKGISVSYLDNTLLWLFPQLSYAIRIRNLPLPDEEQARLLMGRAYAHYQRLYSYRFGARKWIAGLPTVTLHHSARTRKSPQASGFHRVYEKYALPLAGELRFRNGSRYHYEYQRVQLDAEVSDADLRIAVPQRFAISEWDLDTRDVPLAEAEKECRCQLSFPDSLGRDGLERMRVVRVAGPMPAHMAVYRRGPLILLVAAVPSAGSSLPEYGIPFESAKASGRLIITPILSSVSFIRDGMTYILFGNLLFEDLFAVADSVAS